MARILIVRRKLVVPVMIIIELRMATTSNKAEPMKLGKLSSVTPSI